MKAKWEETAAAGYWYLIGLLVVGGAALYIYHLQTGFTPGRVAIHIEALNFDIFWYAICIVGGISLGAYVVASLAQERAWASFQEHVPLEIQQRPLASLDLPEDIQQILTKRRIETVGDLLFKWGLERQALGLNKAGIDVVDDCLDQMPAIAPQWIRDVPWRVWNPEHVWNGIGWCLVLGVIGARLYHVLTPSPSMAAVGIESPLDYFRHPYQLINLRNGGLGIYGGLAGGALGLWIYTRRQRISTLAWADLASVGIVLGQAIGRWGNFFNQELYGRPTDLPWAVTIDPRYRLEAYQNVSQFHPAFLYESLWNLLTFLVLVTVARRYRHKLLRGDLLALYLISYGIGRTLLELVRLDSRTTQLGGLEVALPVATVVSLVVAVLMAGWLWLKRRRAKPA